ncbi:ABC transporter permease [Devosia ureilytica]|uniref:ABC transporter permease n=1 Tax=Devosia ureilytica TaxID=2952754 RepID=A0A9Q4FTX9_9HYPH|nr:ABC transporter permease [Devosia ureilytica]MCP8888353.1 ABC transporter permease [Devosia ureilytica]
MSLTQTPAEKLRAERRQQRAFLLRQLFGNPGFLLGAVIILFWCLVAIGWHLIVPYDPFATGITMPLGAPSLEHWMGGDDLGRDVWSRVLAGTADVLSIAPLATVITISVGTLIGVCAAYFGGAIDNLLMRSVDILLVFPPIIIALMIISAIGASQVTMIIIIGFFGAPAVSRTIRAAAMREAHRDYVAAAVMRRENNGYILLREILPNIEGPVAVETTIRFGYAIFAAASLSFLGVSLQPPAADWGLTITVQRIYIQVQPWSTLGPALALASLVVAVNLVADRLRKVLATP